MSRYIDADALKAFIRNRYFQCDMPEEWGNGVMWATSQINYYCNKEAPSIDIVRCKECKYAEVYDGYYTQVCCENGVIGGHGELWNPDDFCSYGERKESE